MFFKIYHILQLTFFTILTTSESLSILAVTPHIGKSHQLVFEPLFQKLVENGHKLTLISRFPQRNPVSNWRDVNIGKTEPEATEILTFNNVTGTRLDRYTVIFLVKEMARISCTEGLLHPNYQSFLKENNHFDLILMEVFNTPCFMGVAKKYKAPVIGLSSCTWLPWMFKMFGSSFNPSYVPSHFTGHTNHMTFIGRVENSLTSVFYNIFYKYAIENLSIDWSKKYTGIDLNEDGDMSNISVLLINNHYTLNMKVPLSPNSIEIGGIHVESKPLKPLPQDLEKFINESNHGIIYMSMGSTMRGDSFPESKKQAFLKAFSRLPQRVLWKWEDKMENKPENVMTYKWAPQRDVLCHPNMKVFISHAGLLGTIESVDCGKPLLMIPLFGDQFTNAAITEENGGGLVLPFNEIREETVYEKLKSLLSQEFQDSADKLSYRFKDRPLSPMNTALYWIDYVARHKGAHFMKMASVDMPLYQYYLLDVLAFITIVIIFLIYVTNLSFKFIFMRLCKGQEKIKKI